MTNCEASEAVISFIQPGSPADEAGIRAGDRMVGLNGRRLRDVIDYQLAREEDRLELVLEREGGEFRVVIDNDGRPLGLAFAKSVFDGLRICRNRCVFCFVDQLPPKVRPSLLLKDDDYRLSFLYGNFVTLTNLSRSDIRRIIAQRLSPLYVSIHSTDPAVRRQLLVPPKVDRGLDNFRSLTAGGIELHVQIVVCPGLNDGEVLDRTLADLSENYSNAVSVGLVPVGLTGHRTDLAEVDSFDPVKAAALLRQIEPWRERAGNARGYHWVYAADEFYLLAGEEIPQAQDYDDFPQVENGIGLVRLFLDKTRDWLDSAADRRLSIAELTVVTGELAAPIIRSVLEPVGKRLSCRFTVIPAVNHWLGGRVSVAGLLAGWDIIEAIKSCRRPGPVLLPDICLNPDGLFLDGLTPADVAAAARVDCRVVPSGADAFLESLVESYAV